MAEETSPAAAAALRGARTRLRSSGCGATPPRAPDFTANGMSTGSGLAVASSNSAMPCAPVSGTEPELAMRRMSASLKAPVMPLPCAQAPQASDSAGSPSVRRCVASASRAALAAA